MTTPDNNLEFANPIYTRLKISALWIAMLFIFAYVDIFYARTLVTEANTVRHV